MIRPGQDGGPKYNLCLHAFYAVKKLESSSFQSTLKILLKIISTVTFCIRHQMAHQNKSLACGTLHVTYFKSSL